MGEKLNRGIKIVGSVGLGLACLYQVLKSDSKINQDFDFFKDKAMTEFYTGNSNAENDSLEAKFNSDFENHSGFKKVKIEPYFSWGQQEYTDMDSGRALKRTNKHWGQIPKSELKESMKSFYNSLKNNSYVKKL